MNLLHNITVFMAEIGEIFYFLCLARRDWVSYVILDILPESAYN